MYIHTPECRQKQKNSQDIREAWQAQWPRACHTCEAMGYFESSQSHPYGSTTATEYFDEWCPDCLEAGVCPRCGAAIPNLDDIPGIAQVICPSCQWHGDQAEDAIPPVYGCYHEESDFEDCDGNEIDPLTPEGQDNLRKDDDHTVAEYLRSHHFPE